MDFKVSCLLSNLNESDPIFWKRLSPGMVKDFVNDFADPDDQSGYVLWEPSGDLLQEEDK